VTQRRASLRLRLTLSYGLLFFVVGLVLLGLTYALLRQHALLDVDRVSVRIVQALGYPGSYAGRSMPANAGTTQTVGAFLSSVVREALIDAPRFLGFVTFVALGLATVVSIVAGWWLAGRMLRPINEISTVARRLSASTLHERIGLEGTNDELCELADTFDAMLARLEAAFTAQRDFVANASHELRTPLAIMRTEIDVTLADPQAEAEELRRTVATIREAIERSEGVIDGLLILAETKDLAERRPIGIGDLARSVAERHAAEASARDLDVRVDARPTVVLGEEVLLERLIDNLVSNAVRYAPQGGTIEVSVRAEGAAALLSVSNGGDVIDPAELPRLFERFYRREQSRSRHAGGSGLGLPIVAAIAEAHGGTAEATARDGGGLTVTVRLPAWAATGG
jgi:signal transduction histidine kinase